MLLLASNLQSANKMATTVHPGGGSLIIADEYDFRLLLTHINLSSESNFILQTQ